MIAEYTPQLGSKLFPLASTYDDGLGIRLGDPYVARIAAAMQPHLFLDGRPPTVRLAALGDLGGAVGAALLVAD